MSYFCRFQGPREEFFNGKEPNRSINTDETVDSAAAQGAIIAGESSSQVQDSLL